MDFEFSNSQREIREAVSKLCARFGDDYWRECDERSAYPEEFVKTLSEAGWLAALIPQEYGGAGLTMLDGSIILEEINHSGGNAAACAPLSDAAWADRVDYRPFISAAERGLKPNSPAMRPMSSAQRSRSV